MWTTCVILLAIFCDRTLSSIVEAECLSADGSAGQCLAPADCPPSSYSGKTVMCRYSRGRGMRICCPRSSFFSPYPHHLTSEREDFYSNDQPIAFPSEFESTRDHRPNYQQTTDHYYTRPDSNYRPLKPVTDTHKRPVYNERPSYMFDTDYTPHMSRPHDTERPSYTFDPDYPPYNSRPHNSERPSFESYQPAHGRPDYNERPDFANYPSYTSQPSYNKPPSFNSGSKPSINRPNSRPEILSPSYNNRPIYSNERPSLVSQTSDESFGKPNYSENPSYENQGRPKPSPQTPYFSSGNEGRPNPFRPEPDVHGSSQNSAWDYPTTKRTTPRPSWAVEADEQNSSSNRRKISEQKCEEYSRAVTETIGVLPLSLDSEAVPLTVQKCDFSAVKLIVGGEASELGEFPHMAALGFRSSGSQDINWNCGGTLISEEYVMTAGHCVNTSFGNPVIVRLGEYNLARDNDGAEPEDYRVSRIFVHPSYVKSRKYNDIALLRLSQPVRFSKWIRPACISSDSYISGNPIATGWGRTDFVGKLSDILMKVSLNIIDNRQCNSFYSRGPGTASFSSGIVDTMLCAGDIEGGRDTCLGDSGGPLTITKKTNPCIYYVVGITSFGKVCGAPNSPGVYTRVSKYLSWIERTVWSN